MAECRSAVPPAHGMNAVHRTKHHNLIDVYSRVHRHSSFLNKVIRFTSFSILMTLSLQYTTHNYRSFHHVVSLATTNALQNSTKISTCLADKTYHSSSLI